MLVRFPIRWFCLALVFLTLPAAPCLAAPATFFARRRPVRAEDQ